MASIFGHAIFGGVISKTIIPNASIRLIIVAALCTIIPDADVIGFQVGIDYGHPLGHRGFSHSILFAMVLALVFTILFFRKTDRPWLIFVCLFFSTISHGILDAFTNGGLGVGFFVPFDNTRYFFDHRPIQVSPIGVENFFTERGWSVIKSELVWIGLPCLIIFTIQKFLKRNDN